jgi:hypothetical protein
MKTLEQLIAEVSDNLAYDLDGSATQARALILALREIIMRRPKSVTVSGNPVTFEACQELLKQAESWYRSYLTSNPGANPDTASSRTHYYDLSNIRQQ